MTGRPVRFGAIINPVAGCGAGARIADELAGFLRGAGAEVSIDFSRTLEHAHQLATQVCRGDRIVLAVGGDGLAGCVAHAVVANGGVLGLVPAGRGNDFARQLGVPDAPLEVARILLSGVVRVVDVLEAGGRTVLGSVYVGVDSAANAIVNTRPRVPRWAVYQYAAVRSLLTFRPVGYRIILDGQDQTEDGFTVVVANSGYYAAGVHIVPTAEVDDGLLDVLLIKDVARWRLIAALREIYSGTHLRRPEMEIRRGREVVLTANRPIPVYADGEPLTDMPVRVRVLPGALRVLSPPEVESVTSVGHLPHRPAQHRRDTL